MNKLMVMVLVLATSVADASPARRPDFNKYVMDAVADLDREWSKKGYEAGSYYTHDLDYGAAGAVQASAKHPATMCVAAVGEVLVRAIALYAAATKDASVFTKLPAHMWTGARVTDLRPYLFMFSGTAMNGPADALEKFNLGGHVAFADLQPGDLIGFNRTNKTGHSVVFIEFLDRQGAKVDPYDATKVAGFKYFSAQKKTEAGLGYRWAFFGKCPAWHAAGKIRDCGIENSRKPNVLNTGYMFAPSEWEVDKAVAAIRATHVKHGPSEATANATAGPQPGGAPTKRDEPATEDDMPLVPGAPDAKFTGETVDDQGDPR